MHKNFQILVLQARKRHEPGSNPARKTFNSLALGWKLGMQNGSNQGFIEGSMLHKWLATPCKAEKEYRESVQRKFEVEFEGRVHKI